MDTSQSYPIPRRLAYSAGHSLIRWAARPAPARNVSPADRDTLIRQYQIHRQVDLEQEQVLSRLPVRAFRL